MMFCLFKKKRRKETPADETLSVGVAKQKALGLEALASLDNSYSYILDTGSPDGYSIQIRDLERNEVVNICDQDSFSFWLKVSNIVALLQGNRKHSLTI